jgi:hypothetical protein
MKKIIALVFLGFLVNCASNLTNLRAPKIEGVINKSATLYINPNMKKDYIFSSKAILFDANISSGFKNDNDSWGQNIGELSAQQFQDALEKAFKGLDVSAQRSINKSTYLIVPTILKAEVTLRDYFRSYVVIAYKLEIYDRSGKLVYSDKIEVEESGKYKSFSVMSFGGIPVMGQVDIRPNESSMIFEAVSKGVDKIVNKLVKSGKL